MKVERIEKQWPRAEVQCSAMVTDANKRYRDLQRRVGDYRCDRSSRVKIDGQCYCTLHGGELLIKYHLENPDG